jgi:ligand-binding sensor domain-containing protein/signal transduction histidine kinase/DNA-binding response OmpR family regulator
MRLSFITILLFLSTLIVYGQDINLRFQHITSEQGLSQNTVDCIMQDSRGFMWFGTWNGLNRYDGYNFLVFKSENQQRGLSSNFIYTICEDNDGNIWAGTKNGLNKINHQTNIIENFYHLNNELNSISDNRINTVYCDKQGFIWVGTAGNGLDKIRIDKEEGKYFFTHYRNDKSKPNSLPGNEINSILQDKKGFLWVGTNDGLGWMDISTGKFNIFRNNPLFDNSISSNTVLTLFEDKAGIIWVGTSNGLNKFDPVRGIFTRYLPDPDNPLSISHLTVNTISEDIDGNLLIGTLGGLNRFNPGNNNFYHFPVGQNDDYSLNNEFINAVYADKQGNIWIGTDKGGISKYNSQQKGFGYFAYNPSKANSLSNNTINSVYDEPSHLWIGTAGGGLNRYNKVEKIFNHYHNVAHDRNSISSNFVSAICKDQKGNTWIGTWGGGLNQLVSQNENGIFKHYRENTGTSSICSDYISSVWADPKGYLLIGTLTGIDLFQQDKETFRHIANQPGWKNRISEVGCILKDSKGYYWIGTRLGLYRVASAILENGVQDKNITRFTNTNGVANSLPGDYVISLCEDDKGDVWVGTYGGGISMIHISENAKVTFTNYNQNDGLCNNVVYAIQKDSKDNLWLSTDNGLSRFDLKSRQFKNFYVSDGLQSNQFYWAASCAGKDGRLYFGGMEGLNYFYPDSIRDNAFIPKVVITDFKVFNTSVTIGKWNDKKVLLEKVINETSKLNLSYKENVFSFEFSSLDYFLPEKVKYQYRMKGVDKGWVTVPSSRRFVTYTNLEGGDYLFEVKACNSDGVWNNVPTQLKLHISPPFWATNWFRVLALLSLIAFIFAYIRYRTSMLHRQKLVLERLVKERTSLIEAQNEQLKIQAENLQESNIQLASGKEQIEGQKTQLELKNLEISDQRDKLIELNKHVKLVNQLKLRFFTNISHEFRTPLTLILGPLDKLMSGWKGDTDVLDTLQLINRNAQRLLHLINQLMEFRKIESGKLELKVAQGNINLFLENIFTSFNHLASQQRIRYSFVPMQNSTDCWFDHEKLENVIFNLLSNAFKFTPPMGSINLSVSMVNAECRHDKPGYETKNPKSALISPFLEIKVSDTGIGILEEHIAHIFKRFYQVNTSESLKVKGSGIGLSLSRELIKAHHGTIAVESRQNAGSVFTVQIPILKGCYAEDEILNQPFEAKESLKSQVQKLTEELLAEVPEPVKRPGPGPDDGTRKPLILVVEDNYDLRTHIALSLSNEYRVIEAENGKAAYELAKDFNPELIISDIMMPLMDGLELCSRLKNNLHTSHIIVVLLTARTSVENWIEGLETGADDYISKPFDLNLLRVRIKQLIESRRRLKKHFGKDLTLDNLDSSVSPTDEQFIKKALEVVEQNFSNPEFGVEEFVSKMFVSHSLVHKKLSAITDQSAGDFITSFRLKKAAQLLRRPEMNVSEIAYEIGFNDPKYFSRQFKKYFGTTPSEYCKSSS